MEIIVESEELKQQLLEQSKYVHDYVYIKRSRKTGKETWYRLNSNKAGILMHLYLNPDIIKVKTLNV
jgi:hypothetical protein